MLIFGKREGRRGGGGEFSQTGHVAPSQLCQKLNQRGLAFFKRKDFVQKGGASRTAFNITELAQHDHVLCNKTFVREKTIC